MHSKSERDEQVIKRIHFVFQLLCYSDSYQNNAVRFIFFSMTNLKVLSAEILSLFLILPRNFPFYYRFYTIYLLQCIDSLSKSCNKNLKKNLNENKYKLKLITIVANVSFFICRDIIIF